MIITIVAIELFIKCCITARREGGRQQRMAMTNNCRNLHSSKHRQYCAFFTSKTLKQKSEEETEENCVVPMELRNRKILPGILLY